MGIPNIRYLSLGLYHNYLYLLSLLIRIHETFFGKFNRVIQEYS